MEVFNKKETLIRTICFMAFFVAINVVCSFIAVYAPIVSVVLIIVLPLTSAVVEIHCKDRWFPIYAIATVGLSIVVSLSQIDFTIFYVVPSLFTGYIFGLFAKKNLPDIFAIFFASIIQAGLSFAFIPLLNLITGSNLFDVIAKILRISDRFWFDTCIILGFFLLGLVQTILSFIVVENELRKMGAKSSEKKDYTLFASYSIIISIIFSILFVFLYLPLSYLFIGFSFFFCAFLVYYHWKQQNKLLLILDACSCLIAIFLYAFLNKYFALAKDLLLFETIPFLSAIASILHNFLKKSKQ